MPENERPNLTLATSSHRSGQSKWVYDAWKDALYAKAIKRWGDLQLLIVIEECSELIKGVTKWKRYGTAKELRALCEEAADVEIMIEQIRAMSPETNELIEIEKERKLKRLEKILGDEKDGKKENVEEKEDKT